MNPKVSVIMSVYNGEKYLREAIDSILNQTFTDFEFIIIDDGSTDQTKKILESYSDSRIRLFHQKNIGLTKSLNRGLNVANGEYIARMDADDISLSERFEKQVKFLDEHPEFILVSCDVGYINLEGVLHGQSRRSCNSDLVPWFLLFYNHLGGHSQVVYRKKPVLKLGGYSEERRYSQDYNLWLCLTKSDASIFILSDILLHWRRHSESISNVVKIEQENISLKESMMAISELIGKEVNMLQIIELKGLWRHPFPDSEKVKLVHILIKKIYLKFIQKHGQDVLSQSTLSYTVRKAIGTQFLKWMQTISIKENPYQKIKITFYAFAWQPFEVLTFYLNKIIKN